MSDISAWLSGALIVVGLAWITVAVIGLIGMPDTYLALHAMGKATTVGLFAIALASFATGDVWIVARALLVAVFVALTAPVSAHAVGKAAYVAREKMASADAVDESGRLS